MRSLSNYVVFSFVAVQELSLLATALQVRVDSRASKSQSSCGEENDPTPNPQPEPTPKPDSTPEPDSTPKPQLEPTPKPDSTTTTDYDKGPRKVYIMRHAESLGNVGSFWKYSHADPPLSCAVDPELKATEMGRKLLSEEYHGREMALAAGKKFAHDVEGSLNVKTVSAEELSRFVFVISPMRRCMETGAKFIDGYQTELAAEVAKDGSEARKKELRAWTDGVGAFASPASIILAPDLRERNTYLEDCGTPVAKWYPPEKDPVGLPFTRSAFFLQDQGSYGWVTDIDEKIWPDNGPEDKKTGTYPDLGKQMDAHDTKGHGTRDLQGIIEQRLFTDERFRGKIVFMVSHSHAMNHAINLFAKSGKKKVDIFTQDIAQTRVFEVDLLSVNPDDDKKLRRRRTRRLRATAVYDSGALSGR